MRHALCNFHHSTDDALPRAIVSAGQDTDQKRFSIQVRHIVSYIMFVDLGVCDGVRVHVQVSIAQRT